MSFQAAIMNANRWMETLADPFRRRGWLAQ